MPGRHSEGEPGQYLGCGPHGAAGSLRTAAWEINRANVLVDMCFALFLFEELRSQQPDITAQAHGEVDDADDKQTAGNHAE